MQTYIFLKSQFFSKFLEFKYTSRADENWVFYSRKMNVCVGGEEKRGKM